MSTPQAHKEVVRRYVEAFNRGDFAALESLFTDDAVIHGVLGWGPLKEIMPIWRDLHEGLAIHLTIDEIIAEGDRVAVRYAEPGKWVAPFRGKPATGKSYELVAMEWFVLRDGRIERRWGARDAASQARQLGW